jgi:hypothetical protein
MGGPLRTKQTKSKNNKNKDLLSLSFVFSLEFLSIPSLKRTNDF